MPASPEEGTRLATDEDLARLAELVGVAIEELRQGRGGEVWARHAARSAPYEPALRVQIADPAQLVLVGTVDDVVMGYGVATTEVLSDGGRLGVVTDLYTDPGAREVGIGEAMMDALVGWCREQGCFGVDSLALPGDRHTKNFFESFGLVARAIVVHRSLS
jgi:GNAT superfamily N-acetyltransferase